NDWGSHNGTPPYTGLNDCAHFVSECLSKAGVNLGGVIQVQPLVESLRGRNDTKTLAYLVDLEKARRMIRSNQGNGIFYGSIVRRGDIIAFGKDGQHMHSSLYLGNEQITHHAWVNHSKKPNHQHRDPVTRMNQNWEDEANARHPKVTII